LYDNGGFYEDVACNTISVMRLKLVHTHTQMEDCICIGPLSSMDRSIKKSSQSTIESNDSLLSVVKTQSLNPCKGRDYAFIYMEVWRPCEHDGEW
jgi:hypothetical protein